MEYLDLNLLLFMDGCTPELHNYDTNVRGPSPCDCDFPPLEMYASIYCGFLFPIHNLVLSPNIFS